MTPTNSEIHDFLITIHHNYGVADLKGIRLDWSESDRKVLDWLLWMANSMNAIKKLDMLAKLIQGGDR